MNFSPGVRFVSCDLKKRYHMTTSVNAYFSTRVSLFLYYYLPKWILNTAHRVLRSAYSLAFFRTPRIQRARSLQRALRAGLLGQDLLRERPYSHWILINSLKGAFHGLQKHLRSPLSILSNHIRKPLSLYLHNLKFRASCLPINGSLYRTFML